MLNRPSETVASDDAVHERTRVFYYPPVATEAELADLLARAAWYYAPYLDSIETITVLSSLGAPQGATVPADFDPAIAELLPAILQRLDVVDPTGRGEADLLAKGADADLLLMWKGIPALSRSADLGKAIASFSARKAFYELDAAAVRMEGSLYLWLGLDHFADRAAIEADCLDKYRAFRAATPTAAKSYVFGTGPSLATVMDHDFSDGLCIIANSIVKNTELMDRLRPVAVAAGDPIFHAGCSVYAGEFRRHLIAALDARPMTLFVPMRDYPVYLRALPDRLHARVIGVPFDASHPYNVDLDDRFAVAPKANILTLLLLPLAGSISRHVVAVGCDGRPLQQNTYFWAHDKASQFGDAMDAIRRVHPSFFNIDYNDYYEEHCETVDLAVRTLEARGVRVSSLTPSYVPALGSRTEATSGSSAARGRLIALDPDATGEFGHFLSSDRRLGNAAAAGAVDFRVFCNKALGDADGLVTVPVFTAHSWVLNRQLPASAAAWTFAQELRAGLTQEKPPAGTVLYMYCGSFAHAEAINDVLRDFPGVRANLNLFWVSATNYADDFLAAWAGSMRQILRDGRVALAVPTRRMSNELRAAFDVALPVAPHPSTTFDDEAAKALHLPEPRTIAAPTVLFPGGVRAGKGFDLTLRVASALAGRPLMRVVVRAQNAASADPAMLKGADALKRAGVTVASGDFSDKAFTEFMARGDIVVLPYTPEEFGDRTSGLLIDAMLLGRPVVVARGTWLGDRVDEWGNGQVVNGNDPDAYVAAVLAILRDYPRYVRDAATIRQAYLDHNSWGVLLERIFARNEAVSLGVPRSAHGNVDESAIVADLLRDRRGDRHVMLDVGAHVGSSAGPFVRLGWRAVCFEPDPSNRTKLQTRFGTNALVTIDPRAVGEEAAAGVPLFTSDQSTGISGLHAFHESHEQTELVEVTTLTGVVEQLRLERVDFLKIDVEGFELAVLKGFPWTGPAPAVIECEFEDAKTEKLGFRVADLASFLMERGYHVYASEWHPIVRYGIRHDWRRVVRWQPGALAPDAWGNLVAFREDPGQEAIAAAFERNLRVERPDFTRVEGVRYSGPGGRPVSSSATHSAGSPAAGPWPRRLRRGLSQWAHRRGDSVVELGRFAKWTLRLARRRPALAIVGLLTILALLAGGFAVPVLWLVAAIALSAASTLILFGYFSTALRTLGAEMNRRTTSEAKLASRARQQLEAEVKRLSTAETRARQQLEAEVKRLSTAETRTGETLSATQGKTDWLYDQLTSLNIGVGRDAASEGASFHQPAIKSFQRFNRALRRDQVDALIRWSERLGMPVTEQTLFYMAHRVRTLEGALHGRLAASIEDVLVRALVAVAAPGPKVAILEIGTLFGVAAAVLYDAATERRDGASLTLLDPLDGYYAASRPDIATGIAITEAGLWRNMALAGAPKADIRLIKRLSTEPEATREAAQERYSLLVIDGDHTYAGVKADFDNYAGMVVAGGYIVFDDYGSPSWPDVKIFVDEMLAANAAVELVGIEFNTAVCRVKPTTG